VIVILDNRDSFVFNLDQAFRAAGEPTVVLRSDRCTAAEVLARAPSALVLSPGPGRPEEAGCLVDVVARAPCELPILGVCLGHQALAVAHGGRLRRASQVFHGRCSWIRHDRQGLFAGRPDPLLACRYHSLVVDAGALPSELVATAWTDDGATLMALRHARLPRFGLQFHPESFRTPEGTAILDAFLDLVRERAVPA
jgi:anthranilate synthase/aminodeoxychorismate synthase-like glutamine amidotransferase